MEIFWHTFPNNIGLEHMAKEVDVDYKTETKVRRHTNNNMLKARTT